MKPPLILIIEDEADTVIQYRAQLAQDGFEVITATSGDEGLSLAQSQSPALILLDIMLPGTINGFDILAALKQSSATCAIPTLALTNLAEEVGHERAIGLGAASYIVKAEQTPRQVSQLISQILREDSGYRQSATS